jgi:alpha-1,3-mannosyltransferase
MYALLDVSNKQTLNWKFLPAPIFYSSIFSVLLLSLHLLSATYFIRTSPSPTTPYSILTLLSTTLFSGIVFSRSLHYSFYIWYFHLIPFLLRLAGLSIPVRLVVAIALEWAWNQWQGYKQHDEFNSCATWWGSAGMTVIHGFILCRLYHNVGIRGKEKGKVLG